MNLPQIVPDLQPTQFLNAALDYAAQGAFVFPVETFGKRPLRGSHGFLDATRDHHQIRAWWTAMPWANIAIDCGRSGLYVVDIDPRNGGVETLAAWEAVHGHLPPAKMARTPGGGIHYYYHWTGTEPLPRKTKLGPGVDIQSAGGYVIVPPSETLIGSYVWL